jgi:hypothetical protein
MVLDTLDDNSKAAANANLQLLLDVLQLLLDVLCSMGRGRG